jgi:hypothetical protein
MDVDVWVRRSAIAVIPLLALAVWFLAGDPSTAPAQGDLPGGAGEPLPEERESLTPASPVVDGPRTAQPSDGPSLADLERAAKHLDEKDPHSATERLGTVVEPPESVGPRARPRPPARVAAVDLPVAESASSVGGAQTKRGLPAGPCGGVEVRLITDSEDPEWAFASLSAGPGKPAQMRRIGDAVGSFQLVGIEWDRVWLSSGGTRCAVGMHAGIREAQAQVAGSPSLEREELLGDAEQAPPPWRVPEHIASAIEQKSVTEYVITRDAVHAIFASGSDLLSGLALRPVSRDERVVGIELGKIQVDSLLERLGLHTGDIVLSLGDRPCVTLADTIAALEGLREQDVLVARLERQGEPFLLHVRVV